MTEENKALAVIGNYAVVKADMTQLAETIRENLGGTQIDIFQLDRVKVPSGGGTTWEVPDLLAEGGSISTKNLEGVIIYFSDGNGYWDKPYDGNNTPPVCVSEDGLVGISEMPGLGGDCSTCPLNQFGSEIKPDGTKGKGKACKNMRRLFMVRQGNILPLLLVVPPTSLKAIRQYFLRLAGAGVPYYGVTTKLTLTKAKSDGGIDYAEIVPALGAQLGPEEAAKIKQFKEAITPALKRVRIIDVPRDDIQA
jgi:hypothetical protein